MNAERLENLWAGEFGNAYNLRNLNAYDLRKPYWEGILTANKLSNVLEVGCNVGGNLRWMTGLTDAYGVDINKQALAIARTVNPMMNVIYSKARELPFKDSYFDLVFTCGVLIHQPEESLKQVMSEIIRCSKKYVLCMEYLSGSAAKREEVPYRDQPGSLWRDDYGGHYMKWFGLKHVDSGFLSKAQGFDDLTWTLMQVPE